MNPVENVLGVLSGDVPAQIDIQLDARDILSLAGAVAIGVLAGLLLFELLKSIAK
jgi:hypothetical protein